MPAARVWSRNMNWWIPEFSTTAATSTSSSNMPNPRPTTSPFAFASSTAGLMPRRSPCCRPCGSATPGRGTRGLKTNPKCTCCRVVRRSSRIAATCRNTTSTPMPRRSGFSLKTKATCAVSTMFRTRQRISRMPSTTTSSRAERMPSTPPRSAPRLLLFTVTRCNPARSGRFVCACAVRQSPSHSARHLTRFSSNARRSMCCVSPISPPACRPISCS